MERKTIYEKEEELKKIIDTMPRLDGYSIEAEEKFFEFLRIFLDVAFYKITEVLYGLAKEHPIAQAIEYDPTTDFRLRGNPNFSSKTLEAKNKLVEEKTLEDYLNNLRVYFQETCKLKGLMDDFLGKKNIDSELMTYVVTRDHYERYLNHIENFVSNAIILTSREKQISNRTFLRKIEKTLPIMGDLLNRAAQDVPFWKKYGEGYEEEYNMARQYFQSISDIMVECAKGIRSEDKKVREGIERESLERKAQVVKKEQASPSPEEIERQKAIMNANMMYDELVRYTMRDLEKQIPYSVREMYDHFVNVKFANFVKNFKMPLDSTATLKSAKEVITQLNNLNNYISKISEKATTTNIYMGKE